MNKTVQVRSITLDEMIEHVVYESKTTHKNFNDSKYVCKDEFGNVVVSNDNEHWSYFITLSNKLNREQLQKAINDLLQENVLSTKPTAYCNGFNNALLDLVERIN